MEGFSNGIESLARSERWQLLVDEYSISGKSVRGFCREKGIPHSQMYYYLRRSRSARKEPGFIELVPESSSCKLWIEAGSCRIHVQRGFDVVLLRQVTEALSSRKSIL